MTDGLALSDKEAHDAPGTKEGLHLPDPRDEAAEENHEYARNDNGRDRGPAHGSQIQRGRKQKEYGGQSDFAHHKAQGGSVRGDPVELTAHGAHQDDNDDAS